MRARHSSLIEVDFLIIMKPIRSFITLSVLLLSFLVLPACKKPASHQEKEDPTTPVEKEAVSVQNEVQLTPEKPEAIARPLSTEPPVEAPESIRRRPTKSESSSEPDSNE